MRLHFVHFSAAAALAVFLLSGCGSGGGKSPAPASGPFYASVVTSTPSAASYRGTGRARFTLAWPTAASPGQTMAGSVRFTLSQNNQPIANSDRVLTPPARGDTASAGTTATWDDLPVGDVLVSATAYPNADGTGTPQEQAAVVLILEDGSVKSVTATLQSAVDHLQITTGALVPATSLAPATLFKSYNLPIAAAAVDKSNTVVLVRKTFEWTSSDPANAPVVNQSGAFATLAGKEATVATLSVRETEHGTITSVVVPVTGFAVYSAELGLDLQDTVNNAGWVLTKYTLQHLGVAKSPPYYAITPVSPLPGLSADTVLTPFGLNNKNQIVGSFDGHDASGATAFGAFLQNEAGAAAPLSFGIGSNGPRHFAGISDLNDNGLALIAYRDASTGQGTKTAVLDTVSGAVTDIPTRGMVDGSDAGLFFPFSPVLTNNNQLVGQAYTINSGTSTRFVSGVVVDVGSGEIQGIEPLPGDAFTEAATGNALGQVVGASFGIGTGNVIGGGIGGGGNLQTTASRVSRQVNHAEIDTYGYDPSVPIHPFVWTASGGTTLLPTLPGFSKGVAKAINRSGLIGGMVFESANAEIRAAVWVNHQPHDLNKLLTTVRGSLPASLVIRDVFSISDTNYLTAAATPRYAHLILVPVTHKATP